MDELEKELVNRFEMSLKKGRKRVLDSDFDDDDLQEIEKLPFHPGQMQNIDG